MSWLEPMTAKGMLAWERKIKGQRTPERDKVRGRDMDRDMCNKGIRDVGMQ